MTGILLTQNSGKILGPIAKLLGLLMNGIFIVLDKIGIPNIGLAIIIFTIVIYMLLTPLTVKQQKFSKLQAKMNPEIQAIQAKYKNKKDTDSQMAMQQETKAVYAKYGVSPTGSCVQLLIQMPILFALYRVIYAIPAYVTKVGDVFGVLAEKMVSNGGVDYLTNGGKYVEGVSNNDPMFSIYSVSRQFIDNLANNPKLGIIDVLNRVSSTDMATIANKFSLYGSKFPEDATGKLILSEGNVKGLIDTYNNFLGVNIANSPQYMFKNAWASGAYLMCVVALLIPILSAVTQWINVKLMPQTNDNSNANDQGAAVAQSMKTMNMIMPLMSAFFCFTLPAGMGIYWIAGSVVRTVQQIFINKHIDKIDFDEVIKQNEAKAKKKMEKAGVSAQKMQQYAAMKTKNIGNTNNSNSISDSEKEEKIRRAVEKSNSNPNSIAAKANMVREYNERNNK